MPCGCPVDTSAKQKHRPSRQARLPQGARQSVFPPSSLRSRVTAVAIRLSSKRITDSFVLRTQNDITFVIASTERCVAIRFPSPVIAKVRVSGGHLCKAEAPTEPAGETAARRAAIRFFFLNPRNRKALIPRKALRRY